MSAPARDRLFFAAWLDDAAHAALAPVDTWLAKQRDFRSIPRAQRHLTVAFIGEVERSRAQALASAAERICAQKDAISARIERLIALPTPFRARILAAALDGGPDLTALLREITEAAAEIAPTEAILRGLDRPPLAHVTVARIKGGSGGCRVDLSPLGPLRGEFRVDRVELVRSTLTPAGPVYEAVATLRLRGGAGGEPGRA